MTSHLTDEDSRRHVKRVERWRWTTSDLILWIMCEKWVDETDVTAAKHSRISSGPGFAHPHVGLNSL